MADLTALVEVPGVGVPVFATTGNEVRASLIGAYTADAHAYLSELVGFAPRVKVAAVAPRDWARVTDFPVFGFPHFVDDDTILVGSEPSPFFDVLAEIVQSHLSADEESVMTRVYGDPLEMERFSDLLAIHELGHLYHVQSGHWFPQRWLAELFANLALEGWVRERTPEALEFLRTFPRYLSGIDTSSFAVTQIDRMADALEGPDGPIAYAWYQCVQEAAAPRIWDEAGPDVLRRLNERFRGQAAIHDLRAALVADIHPVFGEFIDSWPTWR